MIQRPLRGINLWLIQAKMPKIGGTTTDDGSFWDAWQKAVRLAACLRAFQDSRPFRESLPW